jgi:hypothetical protein
VLYRKRGGSMESTGHTTENKGHINLKATLLILRTTLQKRKTIMKTNHQKLEAAPLRPFCGNYRVGGRDEKLIYRNLTHPTETRNIGISGCPTVTGALTTEIIGALQQRKVVNRTGVCTTETEAALKNRGHPTTLKSALQKLALN